MRKIFFIFERKENKVAIVDIDSRSIQVKNGIRLLLKCQASEI